MNIKSLGTNTALITAPAVIGLTAALLTPTPAAAASDPLAPVTGDCPGAVVGTYEVNGSAHIEVYYSPTAGGTNCLRTLSSEKTSKRYLHIEGSAGGQTNSDEGLYRSYAGPLTFTGTDGKCLSVTAKASPGTNPDEYTRRSLNAVHCS